MYRMVGYASATVMDQMHIPNSYTHLKESQLTELTWNVKTLYVAQEARYKQN